jgi:hypothetical protein
VQNAINNEDPDAVRGCAAADSSRWFTSNNHFFCFCSSHCGILKFRLQERARDPM